MDVLSVRGSRFFVTFIDDFLRYTTVYMMKQKSEVLEKFRKFVNLVENRTGLRVERLHAYAQIMVVNTSQKILKNSVTVVEFNVNQPFHVLHNRTELLNV